MDARKYLEAISMYLIGVVFISLGLYMIIFLSLQTSIYASMGFVLMVFGLLFSTLGGFYGKKKLMEGYGEQLPPIESKQIDQLKQNVVSQLKPPETPADPPKTSLEQPKPESKPVVPIQPKVQEPAPAAETAEAKGVVKILMCLGCNMENPPTNVFCSNCGKRLRKKEGANAPSGKESAPAKPSKPKSKKKKREKSAKHASG